MARDTLEKLPHWALALLKEARVGHLGLADDQGRPRVLPVTYAVCDGALWSIVDNKPKRADRELARLRWLRQRPAAALTVDRYDETWSRLAWVQLVGEVAIVPACEHPGVVSALFARYPQYRADPPPGPLLRLAPARIVCWRADEHG